MAIIKCPNCNKEISDKSEKCIHCGRELLESPKRFCTECGSLINKNDSQCQNCGCPVEIEMVETNQPQKVEITDIKVPKKAIKKVIIALLLIAIIVGVFFYIKQKNDKTLEENAKILYKENLKKVNTQMFLGAVTAENCGNLVRNVWFNTIWEEDDTETDKYTKKNGIFNDDFNDSLSTLFESSEYESKVESIKSSTTEVNKIMKELKNPPKGYEDAYDVVKTYYDDYINLTNICTNPTGNIQTYTSSFSSADSNLMNSYNKLKPYLED